MDYFLCAKRALFALSCRIAKSGARIGKIATIGLFDVEVGNEMSK